MADHNQFSHLHEHKLIFEDNKNLDTDYVKMKFCNICGLFMFINPCYSCREEGCNFSVHKQCAQLPKTTRFTFHSTTRNLSLTPNIYTGTEKRCLKCHQICNNFTYTRVGSYGRNYYFHPFCVKQIEIQTEHRSHRGHPMIPTHKEISAFCDACGEDGKDHFLLCQVCSYCIHKECASLPSIGFHASHAHHPLILLYSKDYSYRGIVTDYDICEICEEDLRIQNDVYTCEVCSYFFHVKCVKSQIKPLTPQESSQQITFLPPAEEEYEVFPSLIIRNEQQEFNIGATTERMTPEECHHHPLTSHDGSCNDNNKKDIDKKMLTILGVCDACVQPISSSCKYYSCSKTGCHFLVHELCATLPTRLENFPGTHVDMFTKSTQGYFDTFVCEICYRYCNGFGYEKQSITADVECALAPRIIKHQSHNHILHLIPSSFLDYSQRQNFNCCTSWDTEFLYICISCDFKIHVSCSVLPKKVTHEFDHHPLQLITNTNIDPNEEGKQCNFCEFCEEDINLKFWFYKCAECDQSFHVNCIPSVGEFSKYKFGGTIGGVSLPSHPHSDHPLTSVRMLTDATQTCGICKGTIEGFEDNFAFQCSTCDFWIHWDCAGSKGYKLQ